MRRRKGLAASSLAEPARATRRAVDAGGAASVAPPRCRRLDDDRDVGALRRARPAGGPIAAAFSLERPRSAGAHASPSRYCRAAEVDLPGRSPSGRRSQPLRRACGGYCWSERRERAPAGAGAWVTSRGFAAPTQPPREARRIGMSPQSFPVARRAVVHSRLRTAKRPERCALAAGGMRRLRRTQRRTGVLGGRPLAVQGQAVRREDDVRVTTATGCSVCPEHRSPTSASARGGDRDGPAAAAAGASAHCCGQTGQRLVAHAAASRAGAISISVRRAA